MSDGTPLEDIENDNIANQADAARMKEILQDIDSPSNQSQTPPMGSLPNMAQVGPMRQIPVQMAPPMMYNPNPPTLQKPQYIPVDEEERPRKRNMWFTVLERIQDPIVVGLFICLLSLPALHTQLAKYASWGYSVGGQLSWLGLGALSLVGAVLFALYQYIKDLML